MTLRQSFLGLSNHINPFLKKNVFIYGYKPNQFKRMFKAALLTTICFSLTCINPVDAKIGASSYLCALISVSMHPGRRLGSMMQSLVLGLAAVLFGIPYSLFVHFIARHVYTNTHDLQKALALFIVFDFIVLFFAGYIRSAVPRVFQFAFVFFLITHFSFLMPISTTLPEIAHYFSVPIIIGIALSFIINISIFPEFGSTYIGSSALSVVHEIQVLFSNTSYLFVSLHLDNSDSARNYTQKVAFLINQKKKVRSAFAQCSATMLECSYEFSYSYMAPHELKPLIKTLHSLNNTTNALHVACELVLTVFIQKIKRQSPNDTSYKNSNDFLNHMKPEKEVNYSDRDTIIQFIQSIKEPVQDVTKVALQSLNLAKYVLAYTYDVSVQDVSVSAINDVSFINIDEETRQAKYPITVQQIDKYLQELAQANVKFSKSIRQELTKISDQEIDYIYLVPREEYFVMSMFILNFRENSILISQILTHLRKLLQVRQRRESKGWRHGKHIWFSNLSSKKDWYKFLKSGSDEPQEGETASIIATKQDGQDFEEKPQSDKKTRKNQDEDQNTSIFSLFKKTKTKTKSFLKDILDFLIKRRLHLENAFRTVFLLLLLSFPGFSHSMNAWFTDYRASWVGFAALASLETNVGATSSGAITRILCVVAGSTWGLCLYVAGDYGENRYLMVALLFLGALPFYYFMFFSPYGKAGMIGTVSMAIVPLSTLRSHGIAGTVFDNYAKRCLSMIIGGTAATLVNATIFPPKARVLLVKQIIYALKYCSLINLQLAIGLNGEAPHRAVRNDRMFEKYQKKARASLQTAETLLHVSKREPRLKGSFQTHITIYSEIIFVVNQILDRCSNIKFLRQRYGSAVLDELCPYTYVYRREAYASMAALLRVTEEALNSKTHIPQFLPSPRIAHLRVINAVRRMLFRQIQDDPTRQNNMLRDQYMGWSACSGATEEIIEYLEELTDLVRFLVGYHHFAHGFLARPFYQEWEHEKEGSLYSGDSINSGDSAHYRNMGQYRDSMHYKDSSHSLDSMKSHASLKATTSAGPISLAVPLSEAERMAHFTMAPPGTVASPGTTFETDSFPVSRSIEGSLGVDVLDGGMLQRKGTIEFPKAEQSRYRGHKPEASNGPAKSERIEEEEEEEYSRLSLFFGFHRKHVSAGSKSKVTEEVAVSENVGDGDGSLAAIGTPSRGDEVELDLFRKNQANEMQKEGSKNTESGKVTDLNGVEDLFDVLPLALQHVTTRRSQRSRTMSVG